MNIEELRDFCISVKGAEESFPFLKNTILVFKVMGKMFAYVDLEPKDGIFRVDVKCDPERSIELREKYNGIQGGTHTRDLSWNTIYLSSDLSSELIKELIVHSVDEVIRKLPKKKQEEYNNM